ncbi:hypothetical protein MKW98_006261 [Papaver atlanticum]|uniref:Peptidase A1 domain-containing protein n=1 Tax=Papaver atlanticum TaxID=357466 RepID=A0AAD4TH94_9MAGN|nr:hypothetical protein MKW98_006261 [Papaver atlanticum]
MAASSTIPITMVFLILLSCFISTTFSLRVISDHKPHTKPLGFTTRLIHRDSPESPFYDPKLTRTDRMRNAIQRSLDRYNHYTSNIVVPNNVRAPISYRTSEYVISFRVGTPAVDTYAVIDTGSDLTWLQCKPCHNCYDQEIPMFDPRESTSYAKVGCEDVRCKAERGSTCDKDGSSCRYNLNYDDSGHSHGILSTETFVFQYDTRSGNISILELAFGCGYDNGFPYITSQRVGAPGLIGLSRDPLSLISLLAFDHFSHCLVPMTWNKTSLLRFGLDAIMTKDTTPMMDYGNLTTGAYYVMLEGISVAERGLHIPDGTFDITEDGGGGVIIDTGTEYTYIHLVAHVYMIAELEAQIKLDYVPPSPEDKFPLCYKKNMTAGILSMPDITFHFSGMNFDLNKWNVWEEVGDSKICLTLLQADDGLTVIGAHHLQNVNVGYDLRKKVISLENRDCTQT